MGYKVDEKELRKQVSILKRLYDFRGLLHFTDFSNLKYIFKEGYLYSRTYCENNRINFIDGAAKSVLSKATDYVHDCVRFYYRGKTPTLYNNEGIKLKKYCNKVHIPTPVFLLFDEELIYLDYTEFSDGNATKSEIGNTAEFFTNMDWHSIFYTGRFSWSDKKYIINKRQAELLSKKPVSLSYLKEIIFRCDADMKRAINIFGNDKRYRVDSTLFSDKDNSNAKYEWEENNFIKDYKLYFENNNEGNINKIILELEFKKPWTKYEYKVEIFDFNNIEIKDFQRKVYYKNILGLKSNESISGNEIIVITLKGNIEKWNKIIVYVNNCISIEEYLIKYDIEQYSVKIVDEGNRKNLILYRKFKNLNFIKYQHKIELLDKDNNVIKSGNIKFKNNCLCLAWELKIKNIKDNLSKIKYYMNNVICISEDIDNNEDELPF